MIEIINSLNEAGALIVQLETEVNESRIEIDGAFAVLNYAESILTKLDDITTRLQVAIQSYQGKVSGVPEKVDELEAKLQDLQSVDVEQVKDFLATKIDETRTKIQKL